MNLEPYTALVLNADFRPLSIAPLSTMHWQDSVRAAFNPDQFSIVDTYDVSARSPSMSIRLPSVIAIRTFVNLDRPATLTRWNVFLAHRFRCGFCDQQYPSNELTFDHIIPRSRGGRTSWENLIPACMPCNSRKMNRTPAEAKMPLRRTPYQPTRIQLNEIGKDFVNLEQLVTKQWLSWLYWKGFELDP